MGTLNVHCHTPLNLKTSLSFEALQSFEDELHDVSISLIFSLYAPVLAHCLVRAQVFQMGLAQFIFGTYLPTILARRHIVSVSLLLLR